MNTDDPGEENRRPSANGTATVPRSKSKRPLTGRLLKPIDPGEAKPRGLRAQLALPPDESDVLAHIWNEGKARVAELNELLGLPPDVRDPEQVAKALAEREFGIPRHAQNWWMRFATYLTRKTVPHFSFTKANKKKHGAPLQWTRERLMQLFADVQFLKKKKDWSVAAICKSLPTMKGYKERWARNKGGALRKAYVSANQLRQRDSLFLLELCGGDALIPERRGDLIEKAIERHALRI
jgi:hypothetical protein